MQLPAARVLLVALDDYSHMRADYTLSQALDAISTAHIEMHGAGSLPRILLVFNDDDEMLGPVPALFVLLI